ncbi:MAG: 2TM domain-containing protein [Bacteroidota bacterium]|nr:2TM domain-containing protein [Bacteroidota bacterium]
MENRDEELWRIAKKRVAFKKHLASYLLVNGFLWAIWWFSGDFEGVGSDGIPWPIWPTLGWGLGLGFNYYNAYMYNPQNDIEKEYNRMKNKE